MNNKLLSVLTIVCIVCVLIIIGEWFFAVNAQKQTLTSTPAAETKIAPDKMPVIELTKQPEESYADLVSRPLFIKGRRPVDEPSPEEALATNVASTFDWQLNGVYTMENGLSALFSRSTSKVPKDNHRKIMTGADLDGWKLTEIHKDRVLLKQGSQQKELLLRKPKLKELPRKPITPNIPIESNIPIPNTPNIANIPNSPQPPVGDLENSENENF